MKQLHTIALAFALASSSTTQAPAQAVAQLAKSPMAYDAVSIKPNNTGSGSVRISIDGERFIGRNVTVKTLISYAYGLETEDLIAGLPGWANSSHIDFEAKLSAEDVAAQKKLTSDEGEAQRRLMMQALLLERYGIKLHHENKELPTFALVVARGGLKLKPADPNSTYENGLKAPGGAPRGAGSMNTNNDELTAQGVPMANLAGYLAQRLHRPVADKTGLTSNYDFTLKWSPDEVADSSQKADTPPPLYTALQEQLGLKLESTKGPVDTIVVDHLDQPSEN